MRSGRAMASAAGPCAVFDVWPRAGRLWPATGWLTRDGIRLCSTVPLTAVHASQRGNTCPTASTLYVCAGQ